jgi:hypothetical protein
VSEENKNERTYVQGDSDRAFAQVTMPEWMIDAWETYANQKGEDKQSVLENFTLEFIRLRHPDNNTESPIQAQRQIVLYASPPGSKAKSFWLKGHVYNEVTAFAKLTNHRVNRVLFSALLDGLVRENMILI